MRRNTYTVLPVVLTIMLILLSSISVDSIRKGDVYEYNYYFTMDMYVVFKTNVYDQTPYEIRLSYDLNGTMRYEIRDISRGNLSAKIYFKNLTVRYSFSCNESRIESQLRSGINESMRNIEETLKKGFEFSAPFMNPLRYDPSRDTWINSMLNRVIPGYSDIMRSSNYTSSVRAERSTYRGIVSLLTDTETNITYNYGGVVANIRAKSISHSDLLGTIAYYSDSEAEGKTYAYYYEYSYEFEYSMNYKYRLIFELRNIEGLRDYNTIGLEVRFGYNRGEVFVAGHNSSLHSYKISGKKLILNVTGTGSGGVYVSLPKNISVLNITVDGMKVNYIEDDLEERLVVRAPINYSEHLVEIEFSDQISGVLVLETELSPLELFTAIIILSAIVAIIAFIIIFIAKYGKKT